MLAQKIRYHNLIHDPHLAPTYLSNQTTDWNFSASRIMRNEELETLIKMKTVLIEFWCQSKISSISLTGVTSLAPPERI